MLFSSRRIKGPRQGMLGMHPLVDVLEGRRFLTVSINEGLVAVDDPTAAQEPMAVEPAQQAQATVQDATVPLRRAPRMTDDGAPLHVVLPAPEDAKLFSLAPIDTDGETLFANLFHDRRGRRARTQRSETATSNQDDRSFRDGRALTGAMRPYLTTSATDRGGVFGADAIQGDGKWAAG